MSAYFRAASIGGLAATVNALRPARHKHAIVPSFFGGWLTSELAPQLLAVHAAVTAGFVAKGGVRERGDKLALGACALTAAGLVKLTADAGKVRGIVEDALREVLGEDYRSCIVAPRDPEYDLRVPWRQLVLPFHMSHPEVERIRNVPYGQYGRRNMLDVYRHRSRPQGAPVVLQIHGGAWTISNKDHQGKPLMLHLASRGWVCFSANYRLSPRSTFPDHIVDLKRALAWIREHGPEYGADPSFVLVTGGSAGGHLSALMALTPDDPDFQPGFEDADTSVQACVPYYGVYDFTNEIGDPIAQERLRFLERLVFKRSLAADREAFERASPLYRIGPDAPPFFVIHGAHDSLVPVAEARYFVEHLRKTSRSAVCYVELPGTQHAFDVFPSIRTAHVIRGVERFADHAYCDWLGLGTPDASGVAATR